MSGIGGIYQADGGAVEREHLERMRDIIDYRGPDGSGLWTERNVGLVHRLLHYSEESFAESQPFTNGRGLWITADCRVDNRSELQEVFQSHGLWNEIRKTFEPHFPPDPAFILGAYELWGEEAPNHLLGDFAFAIWDSRQELLFAARDPVGVKPFVYHWGGTNFIFGSDIKQIFQDPSIPPSLNLAHLAEMLIMKFSNREETPYAAVKRLPPGYSLAVKRGQLSLKKYWNWDPEKEPLSQASLEENAEEFQALFREAVRTRLRTPKDYRVGSLLSGGLDSSSITAMAASILPGLRFPAFTLRFPEANQAFQYPNKDWLDESPYYNALIQKYSLEFHPIEIRGWGPLENIERNIWYQDMPLPFPNFAYFEFLCQQVRQLGIRFLLNGEGGDELFSVHLPYLVGNLKKGRVLEFLNEIYERRKYFKTPYASLLRSFFGALTPDFLKFPFRFMSQRKAVPGWIDRRFAKSLHLRERAKKDFFSDPWYGRMASPGIAIWLKGGWVTLFLESFNRASASSQIEFRFPFLDLRLFRWTARIPWDQKQKGRYKKLLLRQSLRDLLPPVIGSRLRKTEFTPVIRAGLERYCRKELRGVFESPHDILRSLIIPKEAEKIAQANFSQKKTVPKYVPSLWHLWYLVSMDQWLKRKERKKHEFRKAETLATVSE